MKRVLVTGANGFVCSNIVSALLQGGYFVYALDVQWDNPVIQTWSSQQIELLTADCLTVPSLDIDYLIHGAAITADAAELGLSAEDYFDAHLQPTLAMLRYAQANQVKRSIFISSSAVYRQMDGITDENTLSNPLGLYPVAKQTTESLIETLRHEHQRDVCCIRLGNIYGPNEYIRESRPRISGIRQMIEAARAENKIIIYPDMPEREWTFAPDIAQVVIAILEAASLNYALYNVAAAQVLSWRDIAEAIATVMPNLSIQEVTQAENAASLTRRGILDNQRLQDDIGFSQWTPLQEGIRLTIELLTQEAHHA